ncbi:hypothetical protein GCM10026983_04810 [Gracilibacillus alcaliphilus]
MSFVSDFLINCLRKIDYCMPFAYRYPCVLVLILHTLLQNTFNKKKCLEEMFDKYKVLFIIML